MTDTEPPTDATPPPTGGKGPDEPLGARDDDAPGRSLIDEDEDAVEPNEPG